MNLNKTNAADTSLQSQYLSNCTGLGACDKNVITINILARFTVPPSFSLLHSVLYCNQLKNLYDFVMFTKVKEAKLN